VEQVKRQKINEIFSPFIFTLHTHMEFKKRSELVSFFIIYIFFKLGMSSN